jgi:hypothetical protein
MARNPSHFSSNAKSPRVGIRPERAGFCGEPEVVVGVEFVVS